MAIITAVANQKGGVGKTTTAVNLASALARRGQRTLLVDLDPQGNASAHVGRRCPEHGMPLLLALKDELENIAALIVATDFAHLSVIPSGRRLAQGENELHGLPGRDQRLAMVLRQLPDFDQVVIDCPPNLGVLAVNALVASRHVLVPVEADYFAVAGLGELLRTVATIRKAVNPVLEVTGIVVTQLQKTTVLSRTLCQSIRDQFPRLAMTSTIGVSVKLREAPTHGKPIDHYDPKGLAAAEYAALAEEYLARARGVSHVGVTTREPLTTEATR
jgi:chromosome partitioning protein